MDRTLLDRAGVARKLGITVEKFYRNRPELEADGFPRPVLGNMSGARWDPAAIDRWLDSKIAQGAPAIAAGGTVDIADDLDRNAAAIGARFGRPRGRR